MRKTYLTIILLFLSFIFNYGQEVALGSISAVNSNDTLKAMMVSPKYRNAIYPTMAKPDSIKIKIAISNAIFPASATMDVSLSKDSSTIKTWNFQGLKSEMILSLSVSDIEFENTRSGPYTKDDNPYQFKLEVKENGAVKDVVLLELNKYPSPPVGVSEVRMDDDNNLIINGKREIIFGAYLFHYNKNWYSYLEGIGVNGFMEWGSKLVGDYHSDSTWSVIRSNGSNITDIAKVRQNIVAYRKEPQLVAYRTVDEPNSHGITPETVKKHYQVAKEEDPYHPAIVVIKVKDHPAQFYPYTGYTNCADIFMIDAYPIYKDGHVTDGDIGCAHENYKYLRDSKLGGSDWELENMPTFAAPQIFNQSHWRLPYNTELKNLIYQHIAGGAASFFPYSYEDESGYNSIWEYYAQTLAPEIKSVEDMLYARESNDGISIIGINAGRLVWSRRVVGDNEYIILINTSSKWNMPSSGKKKTIDMNITFNRTGSNNVEVVIGDTTMPKSYTIEDGKTHVLLDGIDETSSGVMILKRSTIVSVKGKKEQKVPMKYGLNQNYPNPFNPTTEISFSIPVAGNTNLEIYNVLGQKIATLVSKELNAGSYKYQFDASNLSSGIYFYKLVSNSYNNIKKMLLIK